MVCFRHRALGHGAKKATTEQRTAVGGPYRLISSSSYLTDGHLSLFISACESHCVGTMSPHFKHKTSEPAFAQVVVVPERLPTTSDPPRMHLTHGLAQNGKATQNQHKTLHISFLGKSCSHLAVHRHRPRRSFTGGDKLADHVRRRHAAVEEVSLQVVDPGVQE